jgi:hypothetical protein
MSIILWLSRKLGLPTLNIILSSSTTWMSMTGRQSLDTLLSIDDTGSWVFGWESIVRMTVDSITAGTDSKS